jgi:hypothetical protein
MIIPVATGDLDPAALDDLISLCARYDHSRAHTPQAGPAGQAEQPGQAGHAETLGLLEQEILARVIQVVSGPGEIASFSRLNIRPATERPVAAAGRRPDRRHPNPSAPPGRAAGPDLPALRRILPLNTLLGEAEVV